MTAAVPPRLRLGRLSIDVLTLADALDAVAALVEARRGGVVFTPNVDHVVQAERHTGFRAAYARADLSLVDGAPLVWASRLLRCPLPEKVSGSDLVLPLAERAAREGWRVFLLGAGPGVAEAVARRLTERHGVAIAGTLAPQIDADGGDAEEERTVARVREARPDLLLVALGTPKQELWIDRVRDALRPAVAVGVGAAFDFLAGRVRRAPAWVSRLGGEWLFRLVLEPRRLWRRYLVQDPAFLLILARSWWALSPSRPERSR